MTRRLMRAVLRDLPRPMADHIRRDRLVVIGVDLQGSRVTITLDSERAEKLRTSIEPRTP